ncbi:MAG: dihydroneopterin aldolase [Burkholderiales bacterium]|nr:dihydroneopterin aldolase [Burkholderiales bacterium]
MDHIFLREIKLEAKVGIYRRERVTSQPIELDLEIALPSDAVFATGRVSDTIDYAVVVARLRAELAERRFGLVEELAEHVARVLIAEFGTPWVRVSVAKLGILKGVKHVGVTIERGRR